VEAVAAVTAGSLLKGSFTLLPRLRTGASVVVPAEAGIQKDGLHTLDSGLRRNDDDATKQT
jgi:hypothetical protein